MSPSPDPERAARRRTAALAVAVLAAGVMLALPPPADLSQPGWRTAAVTVLMALLWITEALPLAVTALLPLVLFPLLGVTSLDAAAAHYSNPLIFLFMGGFLIALAIERSGLHRRIALNLLAAMPAREDLQVGGVMLATAAVSMWVSNTATALMMLPVVLSIVPRDAGGRIATGHAAFAAALLLAVAYGASIGGVATLVGTPPNALFAGYMLDNHGVEIGFGQWMLLGVPLAALMLILAWVLLTRVRYRLRRVPVPGAQAAVQQSLAGLGPASSAEKRTALVFAATALLWLSRPLLAGAFPGLPLNDTAIAIAGAVALFLIPAGGGDGARLLDWPQAERLPWGVLILFGGGLSLAAAIADSGLADWIGGRLVALDTWPTLALVAAVVLFITLFSELASNTATAATFLPVMAALATRLGEDPLALAIPAALAASFGFMLPVATPPNAIVFASGQISVPEMLRAGAWLDVLGVLVIVAVVSVLAAPVFGG